VEEAVTNVLFIGKKGCSIVAKKLDLRATNYSVRNNKLSI